MILHYWCPRFFEKVLRHFSIRVKKDSCKLYYMSPLEKRSKPEQIPSPDNEGQTKSMVSEQGGVVGQRKEVVVKEYSKAAAIGQILNDLEFPAEKQQIVEHLERAKPQSEEILPEIQKIEDRKYANVSDVAKAAGLMIW
jgi:uncharacterized protein DUF2795